MFAGDCTVSMDEKNRLVVPAIFRATLSQTDRDGLFMVADPAMAERCLRLYPRTYMDKVKARIMREASKADRPEFFLRAIMAQMNYAALDGQSRFVVPGKLIDYAGLGREVLMVGMPEWIEVWDPKEHEAETQRSREKYKDRLGRVLWAEGLD